MFKLKTVTGEIVKVGRQNFDNDTVPVTSDNETTHCQMFTDAEGNFGFEFEGNLYYFYDLD